MRDPVGNIYSLSYDAQGNITAKVDKLGRQTSLSYDVLNRIKHITYSDAQVDYAYDPAGRLKTIDDTQGGQVSYTYDEANRPYQKQPHPA